MFFQSLRKYVLRHILLFSTIFSLGGCVYVVVGGAGALGGYVVSPDTVEGIVTGYEYESVWDSVLEVVSIMGIIEERSDDGGVLIAKINGAKVTITVFRHSDSSIKLSVKARKSFLPKIKSAQAIYVKIINYLAG